MQSQNVQPVPQEDTWASAREAALESSEAAEVETEDGIEEPVIEETTSPEQVHEDEEATTDGETESEGIEEVEKAPSEFVWNGETGNPPPVIEHEGVKYDLQKIHKSMLSSHTKGMQDLAARSRKLQADQDKVTQILANQQKAQDVVDDPRPDNPHDGMTQQEIDNRYDELAQWNYRQAARKADSSEEPQEQQPEMTPEQYVEADKKYIADTMTMLEQQEGYNMDVNKAMAEVTRESPWWLEQTRTEAGVMQLFKHVLANNEMAAYKEKAAANETKSIQHKAGAARNSVSRSTSAPAKASSESYKGMSFAEAKKAALSEHGG